MSFGGEKFLPGKAERPVPTIPILMPIFQKATFFAILKTNSFQTPLQRSQGRPPKSPLPLSRRGNPRIKTVHPLLPESRQNGAARPESAGDKSAIIHPAAGEERAPAVWGDEIRERVKR